LSEFIKTVYGLYETVHLLENLVKPPLTRIGTGSPAAWLPADSKLGTQGLTPGGRGGSQRVAFYSVELVLFFAGQALATHALQPWGLADSQPATSKVGE